MPLGKAGCYMLAVKWAKCFTMKKQLEQGCDGDMVTQELTGLLAFGS